MSLTNAGLAGIGIAVAFELATHVLIHYTIPGAAFAASIAEGVAPLLDSIGLTSVFSASAGEAAIASLSASSPLMGIPGIAG